MKNKNKTKKNTINKNRVGGGAAEKDGGVAGKTSSGGFDIITQSCLLGFSGDESEGETAGSDPEEEENFPLNLTMSLTDQEEENEPEMRSHAHNHPIEASVNAVQIVDSDVVRYAPVTTPTGTQSRPKSSRGGKRDVPPSSSRPQRASSFSYHHRNSQLSQELAALHTKASSLSTHGDPFSSSF